MPNPTNRKLILAAWVTVWIAAVAIYLNHRHNVDVERKRAEVAAAVEAAAEKERQAAEETRRLQEKIEEQNKRMVALQLSKGFGGALTAEEETSPVSGLLGQRPPAEQTPPIIPAAEKFIASHALTAISMDTTPYFVIDLQRYRVGDAIQVGTDLYLRVDAIKVGYAIFSGGGHKFKMHLVLPK
jgi:cytochrome bd-type quinol oxidase subunit 1